MEAKELDEIATNILKTFKTENSKYPYWIESEDVCLYRVIKEEVNKYFNKKEGMNENKAY